MTTITCQKELGEWTIRVNGHYIMSFQNGMFLKYYNETKAREVTMRLTAALEKK